MPVIKLVDAVWIEQEAAKVEGVLRQWLGGSGGKPGRDANDLRARLEYVGLVYDVTDLITIRDKLVADGVIEIL